MTFAIESIGLWIRMEHYRLHGVEEWQDSSHKDATLKSIRSALQRLGRPLRRPWNQRGVWEDQTGRAPNALEINRIPRHYATGGLGAYLQ